MTTPSNRISPSGPLSPNSGGGVSEVEGSGGLTTSNPTGPIVTVDGSAKLETVSNQGAGEPLALPKVGTDQPIRSIVAGSNVSITVGPDTLTIDAMGGGGSPINQVAGVNGISITNPMGPTVTVDGATIQNAAASAQTTANTALADAVAAQATANAAALVASTALQSTSNEGAGAGLALPLAGTNAPFKSLVAGANITLTPGASSVTIAATGGGGGGTGGQEIYPAALIQNGIFFGNGGDGVFRSLGFVAHSALIVTRLGVYLTQAGSGSLNLGLYDQNGTLLAGSVEGYQAPVLGTNQRTIAATLLVPLQRYYIGFCSRLNGSLIGNWAGGITGSPAPHLFTEDVNGNAGAAMRASFNVNSNQVPAPGNRPWGVVGS